MRDKQGGGGGKTQFWSLGGDYSWDREVFWNAFGLGMLSLRKPGNPGGILERFGCGPS